MKRLALALALCCAHAFAQDAREPGARNESAQKESAKPKPSPQPEKPKPLEVVPDEVFDRELKGVDGRDFYLSNYRGQVFVINIWATWCGPCHTQIPELNKIYEEFAAPRGVEIVGLTTENRETDAGQVKAFAKEFEVKYKLGYGDPETVKRLMNGRPAIPQVFVVGRDGRVVTLFIGHSERVAEMIRKSIEEALNPPPPPPARPRP